MAAPPHDPRPEGGRLHSFLVTLYTGTSRRAMRMQYVMLVVDICVIAYFLVTSTLTATPLIVAVNYGLAALLTLDYLARLWIAPNRWRHALSPIVLVELFVIVSLLLPIFVQNLGFLRVARAMRLLHAYHVLRDLRRRYPFFRRHEDALQSALNLLVFVLVVTTLVYVFQVDTNPAIASYADALYFTVATLTTTGFGDIVLVGEWGRLLSILIMVGGVSLFVRLAQTLFRPAKVYYRCPGCGLTRHDVDAVHCKHCGREVKIKTEGG